MTWRAIVLRCWSSGECEGHGKRTDDVESRFVQPRNAQVVAAMSSSSSSVQKVLLPCARSNAGLDDKSSTLAPPSRGEQGGFCKKGYLAHTAPNAQMVPWLLISSLSGYLLRCFLVNGKEVDRTVTVGYLVKRPGEELGP
ncbi:unnamed protein product [Sphagnum jensenii]|uniref:Uncharacterized protein n=1 Tax=Sphagnum jensenii TaxID=128206 RepID=A0ABP1AAK9_9BRYO